MYSKISQLRNKLKLHTFGLFFMMFIIIIMGFIPVGIPAAGIPRDWFVTCCVGARGFTPLIGCAKRVELTIGGRGDPFIARWGRFGWFDWFAILPPNDARKFSDIPRFQPQSFNPVFLKIEKNYLMLRKNILPFLHV